MPDHSNTAFLLIGYQNDYFAGDGALHEVVREAAAENHVLPNTVRLLERVSATNAHIINLPIHFSADYGELTNPAGLLAKIKEVGAFRRDTFGAETIPEIVDYGERIRHVTGKTGFNAFVGTRLYEYLEGLGVQSIYLAGAVTSICIDSTGRAAAEMGYSVTVLEDCTASRTSAEHDFYCDSIFPLYAEVAESSNLFGPRSIAA